jgi:CubicO group peptidase (beta-lactamase class C family)
MRILKQIGLFTALSIPFVASAGSVDQIGLSNAIDTLATSYFKAENPGCAVGVIHQGEYVHKAGYGMANLEHNIPITSKSVFRIGSTSKQFAAMSIALLVERGELDLDADVHTYLPELMDYNHKVTVRQMVHHIAGMGDYDSKAFRKPDGSDFRFGNQDFMTIEEFYNAVTKAPLIHAPESKWQYSNLGYFLLSMVVERVSGKSIRDFAEEEIFEKLDMPATFFNDNVNGVVPNRADGYIQLDEDGSYELLMTNLSWVGDGGIYTNLDDFIAWNQNFYQNKLGKGTQTLIDTIETPHPKAHFPRPSMKADEESGYAYGLMVDEYRGERRIHHNGSWVGFRAFYQRYPDLDLSVVSFCNTPATTLGEFWGKVSDASIDAVKESRL